MRQLDERYAEQLTKLCERAGLATVIEALAQRCAYEGSAPGASRRWDEAFHSLREAASVVASLAER
jgi:hypothetical protein